MYLKLSFYLFLFFIGIKNVMAQTYKYLTPPPSDIGKNAEVGKILGLADWIVTIVVVGFMLACAITAGNFIKESKYKEAAGPVIGIIVVMVVISLAVLK